MSERAIILARLEKKEAEIQMLEEKTRSARVYAQALKDVLAAVDGTEKVDVTSDLVLRPGSSVAVARTAILAAGRPLHIGDLTRGMGKDGGKENRASLTSSLSAYVRKKEIFTRTAPNTFGLIELGHDVDLLPQEPPEDFGLDMDVSDT